MMNKQIRRMIDEIFADMKMTADNLALRDEMMANAQARFEDSVRAGKTEEEAFAEVAASLGDVQSLLHDMNAEKPGEDKEDKEEKTEEKAAKAEADEAPDFEVRTEKTPDIGDVLGKGPSVHEVLDLLRRRCRGAVYGNWDRLVLYSPEGERFGAPYYRERLTEAERAYLAALPETLELDFAGKRVLGYHGRFSIDRVVTPMFNNERENVEKAMYRFGPHDVTIMGDAHHPFLLTHQGRFLMNTGAVGNPCDRIPQASYLILHERGGAFSSEHVRVPHDLARAVSLALHAPDLPMLETYIRETITAVYSRSYKPKAPARSPWEDLPLPVYEAYASARGLGQALSSILAEQMRDLPAKSVCLLGVAGGNGLVASMGVEIQPETAWSSGWYKRHFWKNAPFWASAGGCRH